MENKTNVFDLQNLFWLIQNLDFIGYFIRNDVVDGKQTSFFSSPSISAVVCGAG